MILRKLAENPRRGALVRLRRRGAAVRVNRADSRRQVPIRTPNSAPPSTSASNTNSA